MTTFQAGDSNNNSSVRFSGPKMIVDPNPSNPDISTIVTPATLRGFFFVTYNARRELAYIVNDSGLSSNSAAPLRQLLTMTVPEYQYTGHIHFSATPAAALSYIFKSKCRIMPSIRLTITGGGGGPDGNGPLALGSNGQFYDDGDVDATHYFFNHSMPRTAGGPSGNGNPGTLTGDVIYMGAGGACVIDGGSGTVANPGIALGDPGTSGTFASKYVLFGWFHHQRPTRRCMDHH